MLVRRIFGLGVALALMGAAAVVALGGFAAADSASDGRAVFHDGNVTTCAEVGFPSSTQTEGDSNVKADVSDHAGGGEEVNVTIVGANIVIDAIVVKGGNGYNVYSSAVPSMIPPFNNGNQIPSISHFFICYHEGTTPNTPTTTTTTTTLAPEVVSQTVTVQPTFTG
jgi:hypothetical protein